MNNNIVHIRHRKAEPLKVGDKVFTSAYDWELTEKDLEKAAFELGETEEKKKECLRKLKEKLSKETNVKYRQDDFYLLRFLRVRKYDVKKAYDNVKLFFGERQKSSEFFSLPEELKSVQELNFCTVLPYTNEEGAILFWVNINKWDPAEKTFEEIIQTAITVCDIVAMNPHSQINGVVGIWNFGGISMRHASEALWKSRLPRLSSVMQVFLLGSDVTELHKHVNPVLLPESLKGTLKEETCDISEHVLDNLQYLKYERTFIS